jgi:hypothetical protein
MIFKLKQALELASFAIQKTYKIKPEKTKPEKTVVFTNAEVGNFLINLPVLDSICSGLKYKPMIITPANLVEFCPKKSVTTPIPKKIGNKIRLLLHIFFYKPDSIILLESTPLGVLSSILLLPFSNNRIDVDSAFLEEQWFKNNIKTIHLSEYGLNVIKKHGFKTSKTTPEFNPTEENKKEAEKTLKKANIKGKYFIIFPGSSDKKTRWNAENFAKVGDALSPKAQPVIAQGPDDKESVEKVVKKMHHQPAVLPILPLPVLAAVLQKSEFYIGMDTGPAHLSAAVDCPTISIFTRGCPYWYYPYVWKGASVYVESYVSKTSRRVKPEALANAPDSFDIITPECVVKAVNHALSKKKQQSEKIPFNGFACPEHSKT